MLFLRRSWLWLYIRVGVFLGQELSNPQPNEMKSCYRFYMLNCSFNEAQAYCKSQGGHLTWNQGLQTFIQNFTKMERTWWVVRSLPSPRKHQEATHSGRALVWVLRKRASCALFWGGGRKLLESFSFYIQESSRGLEHYLSLQGVHFYGSAFICLCRAAKGSAKGFLSNEWSLCPHLLVWCSFAVFNLGRLEVCSICFVLYLRSFCFITQNDLKLDI